MKLPHNHTHWGGRGNYLEKASKSQICLPTPGVFVRFGRTKGEIRVEKGDFRGDLGGFGPGLGISHPTQPYLGKTAL